MKKESIYAFLQANGFVLYESTVSDSFGDCYEILSRENIQVKFSSSKSFESIDIRYSKNNYWFDLVLIKAFLSSEINLLEVTNIEDYRSFLLEQFDNIMNLFKESEYSATEIILQVLENKRAKQIFSDVGK